MALPQLPTLNSPACSCSAAENSTKAVVHSCRSWSQDCLSIYFRPLVLPFFFALCVVQMRTHVFSQESSNCCSNHSPKPYLPGCPLSLTLCTLEASIAICLASLWVPYTERLLGLRVLGSKLDTNMYLPPSGSNP